MSHLLRLFPTSEYFSADHQGLFSHDILYTKYKDGTELLVSGRHSRKYYLTVSCRIIKACYSTILGNVRNLAFQIFPCSLSLGANLFPFWFLFVGHLQDYISV